MEPIDINTKEFEEKVGERMANIIRRGTQALSEQTEFKQVAKQLQGNVEEEMESKMSKKLKTAFRNSIKKIRSYMANDKPNIVDVKKLKQLQEKVEESQTLNTLSSVKNKLKSIELKVKDNKAKAVLLGLITLLSSVIAVKMITKTHHLHKK
jgi:hypothetical protein